MISCLVTSCDKLVARCSELRLQCEEALRQGCRDHDHMHAVAMDGRADRGIERKVDNLLNRDPTPSPQTNTGLDANPALYDLLGRFYHVGLRYSF